MDQTQHTLEYGENEIPPEDIEISDVIGAGEKWRRDGWAVMTGIMQRLGWEKPKLDGCVLNEKPDAIEVFQPGSVWRSIVSRKRQEILDARSMSRASARTQDSESDLPTEHGGNSSDVKIVDKRYFEKGCKPSKHVDQIESIIQEFSLNEEQERAFRIIANHVALDEIEQLRMYIRGMGGTGKSQVLKSVMKFFERRNESHRFVVVAPTGNAASLLGGSTYHHMFGINDQQNLANSLLSVLKDRLVGVIHIFLDEVSMLSCKDLFRISERLSLITSSDDVFGGINMIFAGDFAQLPSAIGGEKVALYSRTVGTKGTTLHDQESGFGKSYWHQVNTVVILRKNMRQREQTDDDVKFRQALENMRYKDCTPADITFLCTRISSSIPGRPSILDDEFRNVPIITPRNIHKDAINTIGCQRFGIESGQKLTDFFSEDSLPGKINVNKRKKSRGTVQREVPTLTDTIQSLLWNAPHSSTKDHLPGKLSLCPGMPVMIRNNGATELCITKGQEATVYGWQTEKGSRGQLMLETLFVKLINPPRPTKFPSLPENVVPLTRNTNQTVFSLPDDTYLTISRSQIEVLPNFAMTDFASQGKTRKFNVVDLNNSRSHQAYYTALSRSATARGTLILQGFDSKKITGGASGMLRQEFRALEMLDYITSLRYAGKLSACVTGDMRKDLIATFRGWKGEHFVPQGVHKSIRWSKADPYIEDAMIEIDRTNLLEEREKRRKRVQKTRPVDTVKIDGNDDRDQSLVSPLGERRDGEQLGEKGRKRKYEVDDALAPPTEYSERQIKKLKTSAATKELLVTAKDSVVLVNMPPSLQWKENSCAYDATMTILYNTWQEDPAVMTEYFATTSLDASFSLSDSFWQVLSGLADFNDIRDTLQKELAARWPAEL